MNFAKYLRTPSFIEQLRWLLLQVYISGLTVRDNKWEEKGKQVNHLINSLYQAVEIPFTDITNHYKGNAQQKLTSRESSWHKGLVNNICKGVSQ